MEPGRARTVKDKLAKLHSHLFLLEGRGSGFLVPVYQTKEHHIPEDCNINKKNCPLAPT